MDTMYIRDLAVCCIIGTRPAERKTRQGLVINVELKCNLLPAGKSDKLEDTVNYSDLRKRIVAMSEQSKFHLIEKFAQEVAAICLEDRKVHAVTVTVDKPAALDEARSAAVSIHRTRRG